MSVIAWVLCGIAYAGFAGCCGVLWRFDVQHHRLPNRWVATALASLVVGLGIASALLGQYDRLLHALLISGAYLMLFLALLWRLPGSFGAGDAKFAPVCAFAVAWLDATAALLVFPFVLAAASLPIMIMSLRKPDREVPYGPSLIAATWLTLGLVMLAARIG